jgi:hypothetical protein
MIVKFEKQKTMIKTFIKVSTMINF